MAKKKSKSEDHIGINHHHDQHDDGDDSQASSSSSSSSSDDDSLVLEGVLVRNPEASDSDSDGDDDDIMGSQGDDEQEEEDMEPTKKKAKTPATDDDDMNNHNSNNSTKKQQHKQQQHPSSKKKLKKTTNEPETVRVEFLFCDMHTRFFHGMKTLLHRFPVHASHSSQLADLIIENEMVGTVLSTDLDHHPSKIIKDDVANTRKVQKKKNQPNDNNNKGASASASAASVASPEEANVFGFASIINLTTYHSHPCIQSLKSLCLQHCPKQHKSELQTVLSGNTARPAGFFFHDRMVNVPLEITEVLHQQLVLDMDYAVNNADDEKERKSLDFGAFVRLAPCYGNHCTSERGGVGGGVIYKYFDDEVFATNAEFAYNFEIPKLHGGENDDDGDDGGEKMGCSVIVLTKTGHRAAMRELKTMIHGG